MGKINTKELRDALLLVEPALDDKSVVEFSNFFLFEKDYIAAINGRICFVKKFNTGLEGAVIGEPFRKLISKISDEEISLSISKNKGLMVKAGNSSFGFSYTVAEELRRSVEQLEFSEVKKWQKLHDQIKEAIITSLFSTDSELIYTVYPEFTGVAIDGSDVMSTDRYRVTWQTLEGIDIKKQILIPATSAIHIMDCGFSHYVRRDKWLYLNAKEDEAFLAIKLLESEFPVDKCKGLYPTKKKPDLVLDLPEGLNDLLDRALVIIEDDSVLTKLVKIEVVGKQLKVSSEKKELGWFEGKADLKKSAGKKSFSFSVNPMFMKQVMKHTTQLVLSGKDLIFESENGNFRHRMSLK